MGQLSFIISGSNGYTADFLINSLKNKYPDSCLIGIDIAPTTSRLNLHKYYSTSNLHLLREEIIKHKNIYFFHLGGLVFSNDIKDLFENNVVWTEKYINLLSGCNIKCFINIGSSAEYGFQDQVNVSEDFPPNPITNYGVSKLSQYYIAKSLSIRENLPLIHLRTFNLVGPNLNSKLVCGKIIKDLIHIKKGVINEIEFEGSDTRRDLIDVRDAVEAYIQLAFNGTPGEIYNIGSGKSWSLSDLIKLLESITNFKINISFKNKKIEYIKDQIASTRKINSTFSWIKEFPIEKSLNDMYRYGEKHFE
ncbi:MAG: NAD(P)-dependent oxidoreductase [Bacteroidota bacterium]